MGSKYGFLAGELKKNFTFHRNESENKYDTYSGDVETVFILILF
jgi:hypothetical protein